MTVEIIQGDALEVLRTMDAESVHCCVTSPPYYGLRCYGCEGQLGMESTPWEYLDRLVQVFAEVRRVLRDVGTLWLNLGDCYAHDGKFVGETGGKQAYLDASDRKRVGREKRFTGLRPKNLIGIPWRAAFALQEDGWNLRGDHVWGKPNVMPESVDDRPTRAHEYVFLFSKSERYYYDSAAVRTAPKAVTVTRLAQDIESQQGSTRAYGGNKTTKAVGRKSDKQRGHFRRHAGFNDRWDAMERAEQIANGANLRSVWWIPPAQCRESHFAVMPERVAQICILAGCPEGGTVLDPFCGSGTTARVAMNNGCHAIGIELNPEYVTLAKRRTKQRSLLA